MSTPFTIRKQFLALIFFTTLSLFSCKQDEQPAPELLGDYTFKSATLVDGNLLDLTSTDLVILNATIDPETDPANSLTIQKGESANTTQFVDFILSIIAPCTDQSLNNRQYAINFNPDGSLTFVCSSENNISEIVGTWALEDGNNTLKLNISNDILGSVPIKLKNTTFTSNSIEGTVESFPVFKDLQGDLNGISNYQLISFSMILNK